MTKVTTPRSASETATSKSGSPVAGEGGSPLSPAGIARSELGRFYWGELQQRNLIVELAEANKRMADQRRRWKATARSKREAEALEWQRRRTLARSARTKHLTAGHEEPAAE